MFLFNWKKKKKKKKKLLFLWITFFSVHLFKDSKLSKIYNFIIFKDNLTFTN